MSARERHRSAPSAPLPRLLRAATRVAASAGTLAMDVASAIVPAIAMATALATGMLASPPAHAADGGPVVRALVGGRLLDGYGGAPLENSVVIVRGERIEAIGTVGALAIPAEAEVISTEGLTVLPGLIDLQVHLTQLGHADVSRWNETYVPLAERVVMPAAAQQLLLAGVTGARDVGSPLDAAVSVRERIKVGRIPGPTLWVSGPVLESDPPPGTRRYRWSLDNAKDASDKLARLVRAGVDCVVIADADRLPPEVLAAAVGAAKLAGLPVVGAIRRDTDVAAALAAGVDSLAGFGSTVADGLPEDALRELRARAARGAPVAWTTAVSPLTNIEWLRQSREPLDDPRWREGLPPIVAQDILGSLADPGSIAWFEMPAARRPQVGPRLRAARGAGALLLPGSDSGVPGQVPMRATWQEIEALVVDGGLTPAEAIAAATSGAAAFMHVQHETGSLSPGKYADIIAVRGDPLRDIGRLQDVEVVLRHGLRYR